MALPSLQPSSATGRTRLRPNRSTVGLVAILVAMLYAGLSQNNAAAFLLAFLIGSLAAVSAIHAWANLRGLDLAAEPIAPVFAGEALIVPLVLRSVSKRAQMSLWLGSGAELPPVLLPLVSPEEVSRVSLPVATPRRGFFPALQVEVSSTFPLGFFTVKRLFTLRQPHHVFPKPEGDRPLPPEDPHPREAPVPLRQEGDDFAGVRDWRAGDSMRHVDWKAVARGQRTMVKQWTGGLSPHFTFTAAALQDLPFEAKLRQLARWLVQAERLRASYALRASFAEIPLGQGDRHFHHCLRALAEATLRP